MESLVLLDYDNAKLKKRENNRTDVEENLISITNAVVSVCQTSVPEVGEIRLRIYGGWITQLGQYSTRALWILASLGSIRGRTNGIRVFPELAVSLDMHFGERLIGLWRTDRTPSQQKMVDGLIIVDSLNASSHRKIIIVSDDDDFVPAVISIAASGVGPSFLIRRRYYGDGCNDSACKRAGVVLLTLPKEYVDGQQ